MGEYKMDVSKNYLTVNYKLAGFLRSNEEITDWELKDNNGDKDYFLVLTINKEGE